ncbi:tyrosine-type recombinase/integrase [Nocardiopsis sp. FR4]|uniref:tyrosine-type recombinase/integrase n=1 Tax=Nocardiopsis sp. FR4 TaxID=2605985 RepID=UPI0013592837|nr:tyrosine-type recombinase/integrase [Nocardiopsis sp. FR4]
MASEKKGERAPNGRSTIYYSSADGQWHGRVTMGVKPDGSPDRRHRRGKTEAEVTKKVRALERQRDQGRATKAGRTPRVAEWFERWLTKIVSREVDRSTYDTSYEPTVRRHIIPRLGRHRIDTVTPEHIEDFYHWLSDEKGLAPRTVLKVHWRLLAGFQVAEDRNLITRNPVRLVKAPSGGPVTRYEPLSRAEARTVLKACRNRRNGARWSVGLALGVRQSEALGLRWSRINGICDDCRLFYPLRELFAAETEACEACRRALRFEMQAGWQIKQKPFRHGCDDIAACTRDRHRRPCPKNCGGHHAERCKPGCTLKSHRCPEVRRPCPEMCQGHARECPERTGGDYYFARRKGVRDDTGLEEFVLPVPRQLIKELRNHWKHQQKERETAGVAWDDTWDLVFCRPDGRPMGKRADWADWKSVLRAAGVRDARVHDGRHTAGTLLAALGIDPKTIQQILGHSQMSQTARYIHASNELTRGAVDRMGEALWA